MPYNKYIEGGWSDYYLDKFSVQMRKFANSMRFQKRSFKVYFRADDVYIIDYLETGMYILKTMTYASSRCRSRKRVHTL